MEHRFWQTQQVSVAALTGPLHSRVIDFTRYLFDCGYSVSSVDHRRRLLTALDHWLLRHQIGVEDFNEGRIKEFLCDRRRKCSSQFADSATLKGFLTYLRDAKVVPVQVIRCDKIPLDRLQARFRQYLTEERGLQERTLSPYLEVTRSFLSNRFGKGPISLRELEPGDVARFVIRRARAVSPTTAQRSASVLRCFFRFLYQRGDIHTNLGACVPRVPNWGLAGIPKFLPAEKVELLLEKCNQDSSTAQRDYAILLLLARLGLRSIEIVHMNLEDIDWEAGELLVRGKAGRQDRLPLPEDAGRTLARYVHQVRPRCASRRVFIRMHAPHQGFKGSASVTWIVCQALNRAGITVPRRGAHLLRHSLATHMLGAGASLTEIGKILRHQFIRTTAIYAKVNLPDLRTVAEAWPGGAE
jgi:site-specific recombinase XerD